MNKADSDHLAGALEFLGLKSADKAVDADVVILNSCVVRQSAEDKVVGNLGFMKSLKTRKNDTVLALMGCMVGPDSTELKTRFPYVDVFMRPQQYGTLLDFLANKFDVDKDGCLSNLTAPHPSVSSFVPVIQGCDLMCTFCIIPYRRGRQVSRPIPEVVKEVELLVQRGVKEVTLLGQTVDAYGHDLSDSCDLADLLYAVGDIDELHRVRFMTSHPIFMTEKIIQAIKDVEKVCECINLPVQAGDDTVLANMRRRYDENKYREIVQQIRTIIPDVSLSTDIIVGFPGETEDQFQRTLRLVGDLLFDKIHAAAYSTRPGTIASRKMPDTVPAHEKQRRFRELESLQKNLLLGKNQKLIGTRMEVLVDGFKNGQWHGRTRGDKLVYFYEKPEQLGVLVDVRIKSATAWSLRGELV